MLICVLAIEEKVSRDTRHAVSGKPNGHIFSRPDGHPIEPAAPTGHFNALEREMHLRPIRFHDLRDPTATLLLESGAELVVIKELFEHAHTGATATVYATRSPPTPAPAPAPAPGHRPPRPHARQPHRHRRRARRRRRPAALCSSRPLTLRQLRAAP
ncbi:tyrosine-type recombinase/integrase [Streptomyces sp. AK08-02]|nr:tyrosine-type recombinase/integrase [Streptomyces sp. AK08-02]